MAWLAWLDDEGAAMLVLGVKCGHMSSSLLSGDFRSAT